jgi:hypothetical protein
VVEDARIQLSTKKEGQIVSPRITDAKIHYWNVTIKCCCSSWSYHCNRYPVHCITLLSMYKKSFISAGFQETTY